MRTNAETLTVALIAAVGLGACSAAPKQDLFGSGADAVTGDGDGDGDGDGGPGSVGSGDGVDTGGGSVDGDTGVKLDVGAMDVPAGDCNCGENDWSYVWIANSQQSTVSKINTRTLVEEGRYRTRADGAGNPSRTSVSIDGRAAVIANRYTGVLKVWAREEFCSDQNGIAGIQTSAGKDDVMAWGQDDCVAWYTAFDDMTVQRPVQWTPGEGTCHANQKVWTVTGQGGSGPGQCGKFGVWVHRLDGDTGVVEDTVHLPDAEFPCDHTGTDLGLGLGAYGGAVDADGNLWFHGWGTSKLARIDFDTLDYTITNGGGYGITVDTKGRVWLAAFSRYDPATGMWANATGTGTGGITQDHQGRMWASDNQTVRWVDMETLAPGDTLSFPGTGTVKGVSVDIDGYIWVSRQGDNTAYKIDPDDYSMETYDGLDGPYTYSDMTGGAINNVACNPEG